MNASRRDLSPYLVHLTRDYERTHARDNLLSILTSQRIEARNAYGIAIRHLERVGRANDATLASQRVACFSETPPDDLHGLVAPRIWRQYHFRPYGLAFTRDYVLNRGVNPVWYLNSYQGTHEWLAKDVNALIDEVVLCGDEETGSRTFAGSHIARLTPYMEVIGEWGVKKKDFSFEREWRHAGHFDFLLGDVAAIITPPGEGLQFREWIAERLHEEFVASIEFRTLTDESATAQPS